MAALHDHFERFGLAAHSYRGADRNIRSRAGALHWCRMAHRRNRVRDFDDWRGQLANSTSRSGELLPLGQRAAA